MPISTKLRKGIELALTGDENSTNELIEILTHDHTHDHDEVKTITIAASDETTDLAVTAAVATFRVPSAFTLTDVRASVTTAPTDANIIVDINSGGASVLTTEINIDATKKTSVGSATPAVIAAGTAFLEDAEIVIDIDQIGSTIAGTGLKVTLIGS